MIGFFAVNQIETFINGVSGRTGGTFPARPGAQRRRGVAAGAAALQHRERLL